MHRKFLIFLLLLSSVAFAQKRKPAPPTVTLKMDTADYNRMKADILTEATKGYGVVTAVTGEVPAGKIDSVNKVFVLSGKQVANSDAVYVDGLRMARGRDYTIATTGRISFVTPPKKTVLVDYLKQ